MGVQLRRWTYNGSGAEVYADLQPPKTVRPALEATSPLGVIPVTVISKQFAHAVAER